MQIGISFFFYPLNNVQLARKFEPEIWSPSCFHVLLGLSVGTLPQAIANELGWRQMRGHATQNPPWPTSSYWAFKAQRHQAILS